MRVPRDHRGRLRGPIILTIRLRLRLRPRLIQQLRCFGRAQTPFRLLRAGWLPNLAIEFSFEVHVMRKRKIHSGGQAIVLVTLSLFAMSGMMGLSVYLGWSYFVQRQAQAAVDAGALAAVHEVFNRRGGS